MLPLVSWQVFEDRADGLPVAQYIDAPAHIDRRQTTALVPEHEGGMAAIRLLMQKTGHGSDRVTLFREQKRS